MSEITPNTPNPVREDAYVEELSEKLGIDPQYIPKSPVWRNEEEIKAIAEMFANMQGGGSSGGGVLFIGITMTESAWTLDKTFKEIDDASKAGSVLCVRYDDSNSNFTYPVFELNYKDNGVSAYNLSAGSSMDFFADTVNDYPYKEL